jgi:cation-transporting ATPase E
VSTAAAADRPGADAPAESGLSAGDVRERTLAGLTNDVPDHSSRSLWQIVRANVLTLFNGIVGGCFLLLLALGQWKDALFGFAALGNAVIGVVQEYRAKRLLDRLAVLDAPRARVLREGQVQEVAVSDVVLDDVTVLQAGDQVVADAVIISGDGLEIDESMLTGESDPVGKGRGSTVWSGSTITAGQGQARVTGVGAGSYASRLTAEAKRFSLVNSEIRNGIDRVLRWISWALLPVVALVTNGQMQAEGGWDLAFSTGAWEDAVVGAVAGAIAMIPLGLVLMTSVAFAVGSVRLAGQNVLVQELAAVEGLARVDVLCIDKTGTLTEGRVVFDGVHAAGRSTPGWRQALGWFGADPHANATARCLAGTFGFDGNRVPAAVVPFSSARKWSAASFDPPHAAAGTWVLGAPEMVLQGNTAAAGEVLVQARRLASAGLRTLVLAHTQDPMPDGGGPDDVQLPARLTAAALLTFREKVRPDAAQTLAYFRQQGVAVKILSGDDYRTVTAVAREVGLDVGGGYDARRLPSNPQHMEDTLRRYSLFGRVTPAQKRDMVRALQRMGHTVAMTGDGVNDALALKEAEIGIAMDTAAPATKAVARLVLLDGRFDRLPAVLAEGRQVIANIERVSVLFLSKTMYAVALSVAVGALMWSFPFLPRQLSATDGLTIGIPAFFLALMGNSRRYRPGFLKRSLSMAVPAGLIIATAVLAVQAYSAAAGGFSAGENRTAAVVTLSLIALSVLAAVSRPVSGLRLAIIAAMCLGLVLLMTVPVLQDFFMLEWPPPELSAASFAAAAVGICGAGAKPDPRTPVPRSAEKNGCLPVTLLRDRLEPAQGSLQSDVHNAGAAQGNHGPPSAVGSRIHGCHAQAGCQYPVKGGGGAAPLDVPQNRGPGFDSRQGLQLLLQEHADSAQPRPAERVQAPRMVRRCLAFRNESLCDDHQRCPAAAARGPDPLGNLFQRNPVFRDEDGVGSRSHPRMKRDPARVPAHHFCDHAAVMRLAGGAKPVDGFGRRLDCGVEAEGEIGGFEVIVDGLRNAYNPDSLV